MKRTVKKSKAPALKPWKPLSLEFYRTQCDQLVTHSFKGVNTNASGGGVRVIPALDANMPYASVRFGRESVPLDYTKNATQPFAASVATEQLDAVRLNDFHRFSEVPSEESGELHSIREQIVPLLDSPLVAAGMSVSPRLRQILVDDGQGGDVCLTPLPSGGFSDRLSHLFEAANKSLFVNQDNGSAHQTFFDEVVMKIGGDKAQNAGRIHLIGAMQRGYRFSIPNGTDPDLRRAFALYYRGVSLRPPRDLLENYGLFLRGLQAQDKKRGLSLLRRTDPRLDRESDHMAGIVQVILDRGNEAHALIAPYVDTVLDGFASPDLPLIQQGLLDPSRRDEPWKEAMAKGLARQIGDAKDRNKTLIVGISGRTAESLQLAIREAL